MKVKIDLLVLLLLLTFIAGAYNYQFFNVPSSMYLNAYKLSLSEEELGRVQFRITLPSQGVPHINLTDDSDFRIQAYDYVVASDTVRDLVKIPEGSTARWWLKNASNSSQGFDATLQFLNDTYFLQVRYLPDFQRTPSEYNVLWWINVTVIIAWVLSVAQLVHETRRVQ
jgi:hypothetical protein